ncbi:ribbon-helix-helix domain-containing protein [Pasteurella canis]|uniref:ribbon-helix-helix domain-containing protein n=1 Tax=Pasteurella canis TaxID=753 RepID=UPI00132C8AFB|nr:CopG family transcriptional regulator [Pasteurella canis]MXN88622.1 ribbon-helix-helix protein, CopG family [Pasteurella canis]
MTYQKLTDKSKRAIAKNAAAYTAKNYVQKNIKLKPEVAEKLDDLCQKMGLSYAAMIEKMIKEQK